MKMIVMTPWLTTANSSPNTYRDFDVYLLGMAASLKIYAPKGKNKH